MRHLSKLILTESTLFIFALLALAIGSGVNLVLPAVVREFINSSPVEYLSEKPLYTAAFLTALFGLQCIAFYYRSLLFNLIGQRIVHRLRKRLFTSLINQPIEFFDTRRVGDLISRLGADTTLIQDAISVKLSVFIRYSFQVVVGIIMMLSISLRLTAAIVLVVPILVLFSIFLGKKLKNVSKLQQAALGAATGVAEESLASARIIRAFNQESGFAQRYQDCVDVILKIAAQRARIASFFSSFVSFLMNISIVFILLYGMSLVFSEQLTIGDLTAFMLYGVIVAISFAFVSSGFTEFVQAMGANDRVFEFMREDTASISSTTNIEPTFQLKEQISFSSITFSYPSRPEHPVLKDLSLTFNVGKTTAIVGPSGSGKSTIISLILGFYQPSSGSIAIDQRQLTQSNGYQFRSIVALVPQEPQLFALSLADNLRLGNSAATLEELKEACRKARILEFIEDLPNKFETEVGERGVLLSAGQKQRVAIARAILRNPQILILDEATSALDSENEHLVQEALDQLMKERTVIVIAHRLSTVKNADSVLVLEKGAIVEQGNHHDLLSRGGLYQQLVERQELKTH